jgi:hypothetical protein
MSTRFYPRPAGARRRIQSLHEGVEDITDLGSTITDYGLPHGADTGRLAQLNAAQADHQAGSTALVCSDLQALINEANAQSGKGLSLTLVDEATENHHAAEAVHNSLG